MKKKDSKKLNLTKKVIAKQTFKNSQVAAITDKNDKNAIEIANQAIHKELETWEKPPCKYYTAIRHETICIVN